ncbi:MAG TPA: class I SAM-dependent methyltransferase [Solirubrobacteraceae bacterium]
MSDWWHVIELLNGETTPGAWDLRPLAEKIPWPDLAGKRCLDVGTADGFWAFELERRGAADVLATDVDSSFQQKSRRNFEEARAARGSSVRYEVRSVFDLEGEFDVVFMGYVLQMVTDPIGALEAVRRVCRGQLLLLDTVSLPLSLLPSPLARLDARRDGREWFVFNPRGLRKVVELAGWKVDAQTGILAEHVIPAAGNWKWRLGVRGRSAALRASI